MSAIAKPCFVKHLVVLSFVPTFRFAEVAKDTKESLQGRNPIGENSKMFGTLPRAPLKGLFVKSPLRIPKNFNYFSVVFASLFSKSDPSETSVFLKFPYMGRSPGSISPTVLRKTSARCPYIPLRGSRGASPEGFLCAILPHRREHASFFYERKCETRLCRILHSATQK